MEYLLRKFEYLECPKCKCRFALRWDIFSHVNCPNCKADIELFKNRIVKPSDQLQTELKGNYHFGKLISKLVR